MTPGLLSVLPVALDPTRRRPCSLSCRSGSSADLAEVLHGAPQVQQHVFHRAQDPVQREAGQGRPQLCLDSLVQERALSLVGCLQQDTEAGGGGILRGQAARRRLKPLGETATAQEEERQSARDENGARPGEQVQADIDNKGTFTVITYSL